MTWGSHCPMCGREDCSWTDGTTCEGRSGQSPTLQQGWLRRQLDSAVRAVEKWDDGMRMGWKRVRKP